ncbi:MULTISPECIES: hypothetical protein [unclassified Streptomyces]|uniref:hypothetical protein n=1 Tax=unclassified Streptomyces TaxID=2593676 RepID=UPI0023667524|nr:MULTISPECIES: hypothetical protein [unclassified Streptomyces]MDF3139986.1 hypothetical protein [Streptomyces sp. T21Q-yed]WDF39876.1 hypothetical protein PBV52_25310 [Streptomyces sp. T12]
MHRHRPVTEETTESRAVCSGTVPSWMIPLEIAVFFTTTVAVVSLILGCVQLAKSPVVIGTGYSALLIAAAAIIGIVAATRTRSRLSHRRR